MKGRSLTDAERARIVLLRAEGMPASWIAEDVGVCVDTIRTTSPAYPAEVAEWRTQFQYIRRDAELFALHVELAPKRRKGAVA
jgi:IS30 family transposase